MLLAVVAAVGSAIHGGYDLANAIHASGEAAAGLANLPSQIDARGLLTFGVAGVGPLALAALIAAGGRLPKSLRYLGFVLGVLLILIYLGRPIVLDATSLLIVVPAALTGFLINPIWYIWLGVALMG
jgi:hypothetical protein